MSTRSTRKRPRSDTDEGQVEEEMKLDQSDPIAQERANVSGPGDASQAEKDEEFWFGDGTIILQAGKVEFRVYRGLLEGHSPVLKELFAQSHPTRHVSISKQHSFPCPVIKLSDSAYDLRHFLRTCMPRNAASLDANITPSFDMISTAVRLGQKYQFTDMYEKGLAFLKGHYTDDLDTWQLLSSWSPEGWSDSSAIGVINLARSTGELSLLPVAFIVCVLLLEGNLVHGYIREDGTQEHLTLDDIGLCLDAKTRLLEARFTALFRVLSPTVVPGCKVSFQCTKALQKASRGGHISENVDDIFRGDILLNTLNSYLKAKDEKYTVCEACQNAVNARDKKKNEALWNRLPALLGIEVPGWTKSAPAPAPGPVAAI